MEISDHHAAAPSKAASVVGTADFDLRCFGNSFGLEGGVDRTAVLVRCEQIYHSRNIAARRWLEPAGVAAAQLEGSDAILHGQRLQPRQESDRNW